MQTMQQNVKRIVNYNGQPKICRPTDTRMGGEVGRCLGGEGARGRGWCWRGSWGWGRRASGQEAGGGVRVDDFRGYELVFVFLWDRFEDRSNDSRAAEGGGKKDIWWSMLNASNRDLQCRSCADRFSFAARGFTHFRSIIQQHCR